MIRVCHLDTCPVGVATQNPELRKRFTGRPEFVVTFFEYIAEEVRELLAQLGFRSLDEAIGHVEMLDTRPPSSTGRRTASTCRPSSPCPSNPYDQTLPSVTRAGPRPRAGSGRRADRAAAGASRTADRSVIGCRAQREPHRRDDARLGGHHALRRRGLPDGTIDLHLRGSAGQSFGAFVPRGNHAAPRRRRQRLPRQGPVRRPHRGSPSDRDARFAAEENIIAGNVVAYGATGGELVHAGRRRRALLRAQLGCDRGRRGRR